MTGRATSDNLEIDVSSDYLFFIAILFAETPLTTSRDILLSRSLPLASTTGGISSLSG
jgi:hypothetical protein